MNTLATTATDRSCVELAPQELKLWVEQSMSAVEDSRERMMLGSDFRLAVFYGCRITGILTETGEVASVNLTRYQRKPAKNAWGKYINWMYTFTLPALRRRRYAYDLQAELEQGAVVAGYKRVRSLSISWKCAMMHRRLGHEFWGKNDRGELVIESPLCMFAGRPLWSFPATTPYNARGPRIAATAAPMTDGELAQELRGGIYNAPPEEVSRWLATREQVPA